MSSELRYIKINDIHLIPQYLLEQVKGAEWAAEDLYRLWPLYDNPFNLLYALADGEHLVKGVLWCTVNPLKKTLFINVFSVDRQYQGRGILGKSFAPFVRKIRQQLGLKTCTGITTRPRAFARLGGHCQQQMIMEE